MVIVDFPKRDFAVIFDHITGFVKSQLVFRIVINLFFEKSLCFQPFIIKLFSSFVQSFPWENLAIPRILCFLIHKVRANKFKLICGFITFCSLALIIIPYCTFHGLIDGDETIEFIKNDTNNRSCMMIKELSKLMDFIIGIYSFIFNWNRFLFVGWERRLIA